jgi:RHS repeat-associated protein
VDGESSDGIQGTNAEPAVAAWILPDGNSYYQWDQRNIWGNPTNIIETYSLGFGTPTLTRTNIYIYAANGIDMLKLIGPLRETNTYGYDSYHELLAVTNAVGYVTTYTYDANFRLSSIHTPSGLTATNIYFPSSAGFLTNWVQTNIDLQIQRTNSYSYANDLILTRTNELGLAVSYTWDNLQRLTSSTFPDGTTISNQYTMLDRTATKDRMTNWMYYAYDDLRHLITLTDALGNVTRYNYCTCGALESIEDALGNYTTNSYDIAGRLTNIVYPDGSSITRHFNLLNQITNTIDGAGVSITNWYNDQGRLYASSNAFGLMFANGLDIEDRVTNSIDGNGVIINKSYDYLGRLLTNNYPDGGMERFGYAPAGLIAYTNQLTNITYYIYDAASRKIAETNANNQVTQYSYDAAGDLTNLTDPKSDTTQWGYDMYGRVTSKVDALGSNILTYAYDADNRLANRWSIQKSNTVYAYDAVGNLTSATYHTNHALAFSYNAMNWMTNMSDGIGTTAFTYTQTGQLQSESGPWASDTITYSYSDRLRTELDLQQPNASDWMQSYSYDAGNRLQTTTSPAGAFGYTHNPGLAGTSSSSGLVSKITLPNGAWITNTYDNNARMLGTYLYNSSASDLDASVYTYNVGNQRTSVERSGENYANYTYDPIGQVIGDQAYEESGSVARVNEQLRYGFDPAGNLANRTNNTLVENFQVNALNELTTNTNGGTLTSNWMSQFSYDGKMRRRIRQEYTWNGSSWTQTNEVYYVYDGNLVVQERDINNLPTTTYTRANDFSGSLDGAGGSGGLLARTAQSYVDAPLAGHSFYHADANGNITMLINSEQAIVAKYLYDAFGNVLSKSGLLADANVYQFSSKEKHWISGLIYYLYRYYAPNLQKWANQDPIHEVGGLNLYEFCFDNPVGFADMFGLKKIIIGPVWAGPGWNPNNWAQSNLWQQQINYLNTAVAQCCSQFNIGCGTTVKVMSPWPSSITPSATPVSPPVGGVIITTNLPPGQIGTGVQGGGIVIHPIGTAPACLAHECGHVAGANYPDNTNDPVHSLSPTSIMYPTAPSTGGSPQAPDQTWCTAMQNLAQ